MTPSDAPAEVSIAEAAELTGVGVHTLRYSEGQQLLEVPRTASDRRCKVIAGLNKGETRSTLARASFFKVGLDQAALSHQSGLKPD